MAKQAVPETAGEDVKGLMSLLMLVLSVLIWQVGADIRTDHIQSGLAEPREKRELHSHERVAKLLSVPRYAYVLDEGEGDDGDGPVLVKTASQWRRVMAKWIEDEQDTLTDKDDDDKPPHSTAPTRTKQTKWLPKPLSVLFGGHKNPVSRPR